jgi:hypothetical protein
LADSIISRLERRHDWPLVKTTSLLKVLNQSANVIVVAGKEKFQSVSILPEQQTHFQSGAALENIFPQPPDGNSAMRVRMAEAVGNRL